MSVEGTQSATGILCLHAPLEWQGWCAKTAKHSQPLGWASAARKNARDMKSITLEIVYRVTGDRVKSLIG